MNFEDYSSGIDQELFNPHLLDETLTGGDYNESNDYDDLLSQYDLPLDEMDFNEFNTIEQSQK